MNVIIRKEEEKDVEECIDINIKEWWSTYKDLIPNEIIEELQVKNQKRINDVIKNLREKNNTFVAEVDGKVVGFSSYGKSRNEKFPNSGEIYSCYILDDYHGLKIGRKLADKVMESLIKDGYQTMITACLVGNPFNAWHKALGGKFVCEVITNIKGFNFNENVYYHDNLKKSYEENKKKI